jgi:adenosylhomocysteine nucleosidase
MRDRVSDPVGPSEARQELTLPDTKLAIVAALEREVRALIKDWEPVDREHDGRKYKFFEHGRTVMVCGGIGASAARRATEAVIALYHPAQVISAGLAGALKSTLKVGEVFIPARVVDMQDASSTETHTGQGVLVSFAEIANPEQKAKLAYAFGAEAVDMEAAAVARGALARGVGFMAVKAVSDDSDFALPQMNRYVSPEGKFRTLAFTASVAIRPWMWAKTVRLERNSSRASRALCDWLERYCGSALGGKASDLLPVAGGRA